MADQIDIDPVVPPSGPGCAEWFWDYAREPDFDGPELAPPRRHPLDQPVPGPVSREPGDWQERLH